MHVYIPPCIHASTHAYAHHARLIHAGLYLAQRVQVVLRHKDAPLQRIAASLQRTRDQPRLLLLNPKCEPRQLKDDAAQSPTLPS
eukprot:1254445-Rhodomonas_salina.4